MKLLLFHENPPKYFFVCAFFGFAFRSTFLIIKSDYARGITQMYSIVQELCLIVSGAGELYI
ncbi:hypothetical protein SporoP33_01735 [Sporosarcina sp. P33]|nr:hypothetical protein SporoP33_01735 [Sporosarcina sp. P33]